MAKFEGDLPLLVNVPCVDYYHYYNDVRHRLPRGGVQHIECVRVGEPEHVLVLYYRVQSRCHRPI
jgi:hypothetical protein